MDHVTVTDRQCSCACLTSTNVSTSPCAKQSMMTLGLGERQGLSGWQGGGGGGKQLSADASLLLDGVARRTRCFGCRRGVSVVLPVTGSAD